MARHSHAFHAFGEEKYYTALCAVLDPVRHILRSHPTLARIMSRIIGKDDFWIQILGSGNLTSLTDLIGGLMARADELPGDGFRAAATELNAFLDATGEDKTVAVPDDLDVGYDVVLFHGLSLREKFAIGDDMMIVPFKQARDVRGRERAGRMSHRLSSNTRIGGRSGPWRNHSAGSPNSGGRVTKEPLTYIGRDHFSGKRKNS